MDSRRGGPDATRRLFFRGEPLILAHRGASGHAPDHTLTAIRRAIELGADVIEADVWLTRDGHPVLHHAGRLSENTEAAGRVSGRTLAELQALDAGYRWTVDGGRSHPYRRRGERIPTLVEALEAFPHARFNLDIKEIRAARAVRHIVDELRAYDRVLLASWYSWRRAPALRGYPGPRSITLDQMLPFMILHWCRAPRLWRPPVDAAQLPELYYGIRVVTPRTIRELAEHGIRVHVWTVNDPADMMRLLEWGAAGLITRRPDVAVRVREEYLSTKMNGNDE